MTERRSGNSRLVYDKATRTIIPEQAVIKFTNDELQRLLDRMVDSIQNFDDRNSPEDWPEAMLLTADELGNIFWRAVELHCEPGEDRDDPASMEGSYFRPIPRGKCETPNAACTFGDEGCTWPACVTGDKELPR